MKLSTYGVVMQTIVYTIVKALENKMGNPY